MDYFEFLKHKESLNDKSGFEPNFMPDYLFNFQKALMLWAIEKGRGATFADCGLGKSIMELVWAEKNIPEALKQSVEGTLFEALETI